MRTRFNLRVEVGNEGAGGRIQNVVQQFGAAVRQGFDGAVIAGGAGAAFDHVAGERPGAAAKANQGYAVIERGADGAHGVHDVAQFLLRVGYGQGADGGFVAQGTLKTRAFAFGKVEAKTHGVGHGEDVGKQNGGIQRETFQRLQGDFTGEFRRFAQAEKTAGAGAGFAVFGQIAASLTHHPNGRVGRGLAQQGAQENIILRAGHGAVPCGEG